MQRFQEANEWAKKNNKFGFSILNNNLALCKMIKPLWSGCVSSNDQKIQSILIVQILHIFHGQVKVEVIFLPDEITKKIEDQITKDETWRKPGEHSSGPLSCFDSEDNRERKKRANHLQ